MSENLPDIDSLTALRARLDQLAESVESLGSAVDEAAPAQSPTLPADRAPAVSARASHVVLLDVGPFDGLVQLRRFERRVAGLASVGHARVLRYGAKRAEIEIVSEATAAVVSELQGLGAAMQIEAGPEGRLVAELAPREES